MNTDLLQQIVDALARQNQLLEGIDWKIWEIYQIAKKEIDK